ncbi:hypothetical protein VTN49DRAFT_2834 [Thermomyces lanuginosus]|uniref:uncharacterized protein n=1 Tax=Thermomyces lanuginosus TaxID=5541 RepID=UPI0037431E46
MPFVQEPLKPEDCSLLVNLAKNAFEATNQMFYTLPISEPSLQNLSEYRRKQLFPDLVDGKKEEDGKKSGQKYNFKAVDSETGEIAGCACWTIYEHDQEVTKPIDEQVKARMPSGIPELRLDAMAAFWTLLLRKKREVLGIPRPEPGQSVDGVTKLRKRVELDLLIVDPKYQGRGIGKMLLKWGFEYAEKAKLPIYIEATEAGRPVYEKAGLKILLEDLFDSTQYGGIGQARFFFMLKDDQPDSQEQ